MSNYTPLALRRVIGANYDTDLDDIRSAKEAMRDIGFYETPSYGITPYGDDGLIDSIKRYQRARNLHVDGVMKPSGETERDLNRTLGELRTAAKSPTYRCVECGGPHGGAFGKLCWWCWLKLNS